MLPNFKEHVIYQGAPTLTRICDSLKKDFNTPYFNFVRRYDDCSEACLTTLPEWTGHFYQEKLYQKVLSDRVFIKNEYLANKIKIIPWTQFQNSPVRQAQSDLYGIGVGVSLIFIREGFADFFHFGTYDQNAHMNGIYPAYSNCLIQFTHYFYDKAEKLLDVATAKKNRIVLHDRISYQNQVYCEDIDLQKFLEKATTKRYLLHSKNNSIYITRKQMQCIYLATLGKTANEIADTLGLSKRTVESHFEHIKDRLGFSGGVRSDIIAALVDNGFDIHRLFPTTVNN